MRDNETEGEGSRAVGPALDLGRYPLGLDTSVDQYELKAILRLRTHRTLEVYRREGRGPRFWRCAGRPFYRLRDILTWQESLLQRSTLDEDRE